jgi:hypothetical protein
MKSVFIAVAASALVSSVNAQEVVPFQVQPAQSQTSNIAVLPANTEVHLSLNEELSTKGNWMEEGHTFGLTVVSNVMVGDYVIVPKGARATGQVTWMTNKGMFGKSGKFEIEIKHVEVNGRRIPLEGTFRQEGEGNTVATVGAVVVLPVAGFFLTGRSGRMPKDMELTVFTADDLPVELPEGVSFQRAAAPLKAQPANQIGSGIGDSPLEVAEGSHTQQTQTLPSQSMEGLERVSSPEDCPAGSSVVSVGGQPGAAIQGGGVLPTYFCQPDEEQ